MRLLKTGLSQERFFIFKQKIPKKQSENFTGKARLVDDSHIIHVYMTHWLPDI